MSEFYPTKTLAQLRQMIFDGLGFPTPLANVQTRSLVNLQSDMLVVLGFGATISNPAPGVLPMLAQFINTAQQDLWRSLELDQGAASVPSLLVNSGDLTTLDYMPIYNMALGMAKSFYAQPDAGTYFQMGQKYLADYAHRMPPNAAGFVNRMLKNAQEYLFHHYDIFRTERWYTWTLIAGTRFYGIDDNDETVAVIPCLKTVDVRLITWVGVSDGDNNWRPLRKGIPPVVYNSNQTGPPTHYEIRECIEVWPTPYPNWLLRIKGTFGLLAFEADADVNTLDWQAIYLTALGNCKVYYKQDDAKLVMNQAQMYISDVIAGSHAGGRYFPGSNHTRNLEAVRPVLV